MQLSQTPIVPASVQIEVDADPGGDVFGTPPGPSTPWTEVPNLGGSGPEAQVFTVDYATGVVTFGDGVHGRGRPPVSATSARPSTGWRRGGRRGRGRRGQRPADLGRLRDRGEQPLPGHRRDRRRSRLPRDHARRAGTAAGSRAVTPADYGVLAVNAPGARVARAQGVAGLHPGYPGVPVPGVVGVLCVAPDPGTGDPPVPAEDDLREVTRYLAGQAAPAGVQVVAAAAAFHLVTIEAWLVLDPGYGQPDLLSAAGTALDGYLHPLTGGDAGTGWPFGGPLGHVALVRSPALRSRGARRAPADRDAGRDQDPAVYRRPDPGEHAPLATRPPATSRARSRLMSCAPGPPTYRLLDHLVGWDHLDVCHLTDPDDPGGIQLAPLRGTGPERGDFLPWLPDPRLAPGCGRCAWYLATPRRGLLRRDPCEGWLPAWPPGCDPELAGRPHAIAARGHLLAAATGEAVYLWRRGRGSSSLRSSRAVSPRWPSLRGARSCWSATGPSM